MADYPPSRVAQWAILINVLLAGSLLVGLTVVMWWQPILADEWDFYRAATNWPQDRYLIPHPHAYIHLVQLSFMVFSQSFGSARLIGVLTALVNLALIPPLTYAFCGQGRQAHRIAIGAIWLYALNPTTAQNMMLLDIDNTLLVSVLLVTLWVWKTTQHRTFSWRMIALSLTFAMALWVKLSTPLLLMGCVGVFHLLRGEVRRTGELVLTTLVGGSMFLVTFELYTRLTGFAVDIFGYTFGRAPGFFTAIRAMLLRFPQGMGVFMMWLSLPFTLLLVLVVGGAIIRLIKHQLEDRDLLAIYVVATTLFYALAIPPAWGYPRYQAPVVPVIAILVSALIVSACLSLPRRARLGVAGLGAAALAYQAAIIRDPLWTLYAVTFETSTGDLAQRLTQGVSELVKLSIPIASVLLVAYLLSLLWKIKASLTLVFALGTLSFAHMASMVAVQVPADYSTRYRYTYDYGDLLQTIADLERTEGYVLAVKDVLYYTELPGEEIYGYVCPTCSPQALIDKLRSMRVDALAWTTKEDNRSPNISKDPTVVQTLNTCYTRVTHGVFIVYLRRPGGRCP